MTDRNAIPSRAAFCCACNADTNPGKDGRCAECGEPRVGGAGYGPAGTIYLVNGVRFLRLPDDLHHYIAVKAPRP